MKMCRCVAGSRCAVEGWLAAPKCAAAAWQLQDVVQQRGGSALIARGAARVVSITLFTMSSFLMYSWGLNLNIYLGILLLMFFNITNRSNMCDTNN
jgi:hypothetical protein